MGKADDPFEPESHVLPDNRDTFRPPQEPEGPGLLNRIAATAVAIGIVALFWTAHRVIAASDDGGTITIRATPVPATPVPTASAAPEPVYLERPTPEIREKVREVLGHVVARVRAGEWAQAEEIVRAQDVAETGGCEWALVQQVYLADDDLSRIGAEAVMRGVQASFEAADGTYRVRRDVPTTPEIRHAYRDGRVAHDVLPRRTLVFLAVRCASPEPSSPSPASPR